MAIFNVTKSEQQPGTELVVSKEHPDLETAMAMARTIETYDAGLHAYIEEWGYNGSKEQEGQYHTGYRVWVSREEHEKWYHCDSYISYIRVEDFIREFKVLHG